MLAFETVSRVTSRLVCIVLNDALRNVAKDLRATLMDHLGQPIASDI